MLKFHEFKDPLILCCPNNTASKNQTFWFYKTLLNYKLA